MKKTKIVMALALSSMLLLSGCANKAMVDTAEKQGFLGNYKELEADKKYEGAMTWVATDANFKNYNSVMVAPVTVLSGVESGGMSANQKALLQEMAQYLTKGYRDAIRNSGSYQLADAAGPNTMRLDLQVSAVAVNSDDMKFYQFIPVALVLTGIKRAIDSGAAVRILGEGKLVDSQSNKTLLKGMNLVKGKEIKTSAAELTFADVKPSLDLYIKNFSERLTALPKN